MPYTALQMTTKTHLLPMTLAPDERTGAYLRHLSPLLGLMLPSIGHLIGPLLAWQLLRKTRGLDEQGKEVLNFQLSLTLYSLLLSVLAFILFSTGLLGGMTAIFAPILGSLSMFGALAGFSAVLLPIMLLGSIVPFIFMLIGLIRASSGEVYRYPLTIRFVS